MARGVANEFKFEIPITLRVADPKIVAEFLINVFVVLLAKH